MDILKSIAERPHEHTVESIRRRLAHDSWLCNKALAQWARATLSEEVHAYPLDIALPLVGHCNAKCHFCTFCRYEPFHLAPEDIGKFDALIRHCDNYGFSAYGEPLAHPEFESIANEICNRMDERATTYLVTNGILLEKKMEVVQRRCDSISVSVNAASPETHAARMGVSEKHFPSILNAIKSLTHEANPDRLVSMSFVVTKDSLEEISEIVRIANELNVWKLYLNPLGIQDDTSFAHSKNTTRQAYLDLDPTLHPDYERLVKSALAAIGESDVTVETNLFHEGKERELPKRFKCSYLYERMLIMDKDKTMRVCCYMDSIDGQTATFDNDSNFIDKWNSDIFRKVRRRLASGDYMDMCRRCIITQSNLYSSK